MIISQKNFTDIEQGHFSVFIAASGYEKRASYQTQKFKGTADRKIVLSFDHEKDHPNRIINDAFFKEKGFDAITVDNEQADTAIFKNLVSEIYAQFAAKEIITVYIDYSSMTKNWYAYLLYAFNITKSSITTQIIFGYTHAKYIKFDGKNALNRVVSPMSGYCNLTVPSKPTALIIGMGNEPNRMYGLKEYFDAVPYVFYSDASYNHEFTLEIEECNKEFLSEIKPENIFKFPIYDLKYTGNLLENLCNVLVKNFRVIIAPCGPKPFALLSMVTSLKVKDNIEVWRISPGQSLSKIDREPLDLISVLCVEL